MRFQALKIFLQFFKEKEVSKSFSCYPYNKKLLQTWSLKNSVTTWATQCHPTCSPPPYPGLLRCLQRRGSSLLSGLSRLATQVQLHSPKQCPSHVLASETALPSNSSPLYSPRGLSLTSAHKLLDTLAPVPSPLASVYTLCSHRCPHWHVHNLPPSYHGWSWVLLLWIPGEFVCCALILTAKHSLTHTDWYYVFWNFPCIIPTLDRTGGFTQSYKCVLKYYFSV